LGPEKYRKTLRASITIPGNDATDSFVASNMRGGTMTEDKTHEVVMARFIVELWDTEGKALEPGFGGESFEFEFPPSVPQVGETVVVLTGNWRVERRTFYYYRLDSGQNVSKVVLICSKIE
jgi:hypothetical protein